MNYRRYFSFAILFLFTTLLGAQNTLSISDLQGATGKTVSIPVSLTNSNEVVAVQFNVQLPFSIASDAKPAINEQRSSNGHTISLHNLGGNKYTVLIMNTNNKPIPGNGGVLAEIPMAVTSGQPGEVFSIQMSDIVLADKTGNNICSNTDPDASAFIIQRDPSPDLECSAVKTTQTKILPGEELSLSWTVKNIGEEATGGGWKETISLVNSQTGNTTFLGTTYYASSLAAKSSVERKEVITAPQIFAMNGNAYLRVTVEPNSDVNEYQTDRVNNTATSADAYPLVGSLFLSSPVTTLEEGITSARITLTRSGDTNLDETVTLKQSIAGVLDMVSQVIIPAGQSSTSFDIKSLDNTVVNDYSSVAITAQSASNDVEVTTLELAIEDNDNLPMTITLDKSEYNEGETIHGTLSVPRRIGQEDLVVFLTIEQSKRFRLPLAVTFAPGATEATFDIPVLQDNVPANAISIELTATADRYEKASKIFILNDDDVPAIDLTLNTNTVSEGAGPQAIYATISRTDVTTSNVIVKLSDDSNGQLYYTNSITLEEGVTEKTVIIGVVDNAMVDGERNVTLTAEVYISSCNCNVVGTKQTSVTKTITLLDNDGPALTLAADKSTILEGDATGATMTVSRNTSTTSPLIVKLNANKTGITLPAEVTIPAGSASTTFTLIAESNSVQEGNYVVNLTAEADGFSKGAAWIMVSDQTLPDMELTDLTLSAENVVAGDEFSVKVKVTNIGAAAVPERSKVTIVAGQQSIILTIPEAIAIGETQELTASFTASMVPGTYTVSAVANANNEFVELQTLNNQQTSTITVGSCYVLDIQTDKSAYNQGDVIILSGTVKSLRGDATGLQVEPYVIYFGARTAMKAQVGSDGTFTATYKLPDGMGGEFSFGACIPGENATTVMAKASVYGIARQSATYIKAYFHPNEPIDIEVPIVNLSNLPVHHLKAIINDESGHITTQCPDIDVIPGNATATLKLTCTSSELTKVQDFERLGVSLTTDEDAKLSFTIYTFTSSPDPVLTLGTTSISTTINKDRARVIPVVITNRGKGETGKVTVDIPSGQKFVSLASSADIPSLAYGDSATIMLKFNPEGLDVNVVQKGSIAFNCAQGDGQLLYYNIKTVSDETGNLLVRVQDENTIYGNAAGEHPYVSGATVTVKDYNSGTVLYTGTTGTEGTAQFDGITEGAYLIHVTAPKHDSYTQNVLVSPGETTEHLASISYQAISVSWDVVETTTEDEYDISTQLEYETRVPVPVVTCTYPDSLNLNSVLDGNNILFNIVLRNEGLITAQNVCVQLPQREGFSFTPLAEFQGFTLAPEESRIIPVYVSLESSTPDAIKSRYNAGPKREVTYTCTDEVMWGWEWVCKETSYEWIEKPIQWLLRTCIPHGTPDPPVVNHRDPDPVDPPEQTGPEYEPRLRYVTHPVSQVNIEAIYDITCKLLCSMVCFAPDFPPQCQPQVPKSFDMKGVKEAMSSTSENCFLSKIPEKFQTLYCIAKAVSRDYNSKSAPRKEVSKNTSLLNDLDLYSAYLGNYFHFVSYITDSPEMLNDTTTMKLVIPAIQDILWKVGQLHDDGQLYKLSNEELYNKTLALMPQKRSNWMDFDLKHFVQRQFNTYCKEDGKEYDASMVYSVDTLKAIKMVEDDVKCRLVDLGFTSWEGLVRNIYDLATELYEGESGTCATVKLEINQEMVLTRQAFRGTMVIDNSSETDLTEIEALITAKDENGVLATSREMQINTESTEGFTTGEDGKLKLSAGQKGTVTYLFIPTKYAAPETDVQYSFGGTLYFNDGNDLQARSLYPVTLTVRPTPELDLTYFMQKDIYGDDPLTPDVSEPVVPAEFSVLVNNKGKGEATNVRMVTHQPQIIDNEKGLLVDFAIVSSSLNGSDKSMALEDDIATEFGDIEAGKTAYATWDLTCSLLGHFTDYDVSYTHVTSYDNPDLSLLDNVTIHKLIHSVNANKGDDILRAWVTDDFTDSQNNPDHIYFSDGLDASLETLNDATTIEAIDATHYRITVDVPVEEWFYLSVINPGGRRSRLVSVINENTQEALDINNVWCTQYTLREGKNPLEEYRLHLVDDAQEKCTRHYIVEFEPMAEKELEVAISGDIAENGVNYNPIESLTVHFNKPIVASTFTREDITLRCEGQQLDTDLPITQVDDATFTVNTSALTQNGYYYFRVGTDGVTDTEGYQGSNGAIARWTLVKDGLVHYLVRSYPSSAYGNISGASTDNINGADYGSTLNLTALPLSGTKFAYWGTLDKALDTENPAGVRKQTVVSDNAVKESDFTLFSENPSISIDMIRDYNLYAIFRPNQYTVNVSYDAAAGQVNIVTGSYAYGDVLHIVATPVDGYVVDGIKVNGSLLSTTAELDYTVQGDDQIEILFRSLAPTDVILTEKQDYTPVQIDNANVVLLCTFVKGIWNTICLPCPVESPNDVFGNGTRVARLEKYEDGFVGFSPVDKMQANIPYLIQPGSLFEVGTAEREERTSTYQIGLTSTYEPEGDVPADKVSNLAFIGTYTQQPLDMDSGNFYLSNNTFNYVDEKVEVNTGRFHGYFHTDDANVRKLMFGNGGDNTGIENVNSNIKPMNIYGIDGVKYQPSSSLHKGIYITNGHKILVR